MVKRWLSVPVVIVATLVSGCAVFATSKAVTKLEEWGETQTEFPGARVERHSWKMGTTGAAVHHSVGSLAEARHFEEVLRAEVARIRPPRSSRFVGRVDWPVEGGHTSYEFPAEGTIDEGLWQVADAALPEAATTRRLGWTETRYTARTRGPAAELIVMEYVSTDPLATAGNLPADDRFFTVVVAPGDGTMGPFPAPEFAPRARALQDFGPERLQFAGQRLEVLEPTDLVPAARALDEHPWTLHADKWLTVDVGPGLEPPLELLTWIIESDGGYSLTFAARQFDVGAGIESAGCEHFLAEAPDPGRPFKLTCPTEAGRIFTEGTLAQLRTLQPAAQAAMGAGATYANLAPGRLSVRFDPERPETWPQITAALRTIAWEGEWEINLQGRFASRMTFRSTADGTARGVEHDRRSSEESKAEVDQLVAAWDATATR